MAPQLVECVPNFSEGRDPQRLEQILDAIRAVDGVDLLDVDPGKETNRTVVTFVGSPAAVEEGAFQAIARAAEVIDMTQHEGAHARHGATDVCPFIPVSGVTMDDCIEIAKRLGERVGRELELPVYLYDQAAQLPERSSLAHVRKGEYEALPEKLAAPEWKPDFGPAKFVPRTGVVTIGAREFLIAYNVNLNSRAVEHAKDLAFEIREGGRAVRVDQTTPYYSSGRLLKYRPSENVFPSAYSDVVCASLDELAAHYREAYDRDLYEELAFLGRDPQQLEGLNVKKRGLFHECRAVGWLIPEYGRAQISINLTNFKVTSTHDVIEACRSLAADRNLIVTGSEIVGMVPYQAMRETGEWYLQKQGSSRGVPVADVIETAVQSLGLRDIGDFDAKKSVLGMPTTDGDLASMRVNDLADEVSRATPAPGGGSIAALAGSLGASLGSMVANLTQTKPKLSAHHESMEQAAMRCQQLKDDLLRAIDADTNAFNEVIAAMRLPKGTPAEAEARTQAIEAGYKQATTVPLETAELCLEAIELCRTTAENGLASSVTDAGVGALMGHAGLKGAIYNVQINLGSINDTAWVENVRGQLAEMLRRGAELAAAVEEIVLSRME